MTDDDQAIRSLISRWQELTQSGDVDGVLALMTDDVVFTVVGRAPFGKAEFAEAARGMRGLKIDTESQLLEVTVQGDTAWSRVELRVVIDKPDGNTVRREGHAMSIYRKQSDGRWLMARDANMLGQPK